MPLDAKPPQRLLVVLPTWVGDCVMATPLLRALRRGLPEARIVGWGPRGTASILRGLPYLDRLRTRRKNESLLDQAGRIRAGRFDATMLLPGSFRSAAVLRLAGVPRRIGYGRDGRGWLLTDALAPETVGRWPRRSYATVPTIDYYLRLLDPLGIEANGREMTLGQTAREARAAAAVLEAANVAGSGGPRVILVPGGNYGSAKLWPPAHFAALADRLVEQFDARVAISVAPNERPIADDIRARCRLAKPVDLSRHGLTLGALKGVCRAADLVVTNDTGTRHVAAAVGAKLVTLFGPTNEKWTTLYGVREIELSEPVPCRPCQLKRCPLPPPQTQRCLTELSPDRVLAACEQMLRPGVPLRVAS